LRPVLVSPSYTPRMADRYINIESERESFEKVCALLQGTARVDSILTRSHFDLFRFRIHANLQL